MIYKIHCGKIEI